MSYLAFGHQDNTGEMRYRVAVRMTDFDSEVGQPGVVGDVIVVKHPRQLPRRCLEEAGFEPSSMDVETLTASWHIPTADFLFEAERKGGVRTAGLLARQRPEVLAKIKTELGQAVQQFATDGGFAIPMAAHVLSVTAEKSSAD